MTDGYAVRALVAKAIATGPRGTAARLARTLGVSRQTASAWSNGALTVQPRWFLLLEAELGLEQWTLAEAAGLLDDHARGLTDEERVAWWRQKWPAPLAVTDVSLPGWSAELVEALADVGPDLTDREKRAVVEQLVELAQSRRNPA